MKLIKHQYGAILMVSLVLLFLFTLLISNLLQTSLLEEKISANEFSRSSAFQAAESALRDAEQFITSSDPVFNPLELSNGPFQGADCVNGLCPFYIFPLCLVADFNWSTKARGMSGSLPYVVQVPKYVIELVSHSVSDDGESSDALFRITSRAWGKDINTVVQLQSYFSLNTVKSRRIAWREIVN